MNWMSSTRLQPLLRVTRRVQLEVAVTVKIKNQNQADAQDQNEQMSVQRIEVPYNVGRLSLTLGTDPVFTHYDGV